MVARPFFSLVDRTCEDISTACIRAATRRLWCETGAQAPGFVVIEVRSRVAATPHLVVKAVAADAALSAFL